MLRSIKSYDNLKRNQSSRRHAMTPFFSDVHSLLIAQFHCGVEDYLVHGREIDETENVNDVEIETRIIVSICR